MKATVLFALLTLTSLAQAQGLTVKEADITGKTDLVAIAKATVKGVAESILTDSAGISLYTFKNDAPNKSNCAGKCLREWPPQHVPAGAQVLAPFGSIPGNDGKAQLTLNGAPLYHYDDDQKPGDTFGQYPGWDAIVVVP